MYFSKSRSCVRLATITVPTASPVTLVQVPIMSIKGYSPMTKVTASAGTPIWDASTVMQIRPEPGAPGAPTESTMMEMNMESRTLPVTVIPNILAIKRVVIISSKQVPSILIVAPSGNENE